MAQSEIIEILKKYCTLLNLSGIKVEKAFLYGSHARGDASPDSDIDILLVSKSFDNSDEEAIKAWSFTRKIDTRIEPYTVGLHQFLNDEVSPLLQIIKQHGIEVEL
jgi:uncharacterized protein